MPRRNHTRQRMVKCSSPYKFKSRSMRKGHTKGSSNKGRQSKSSKQQTTIWHRSLGCTGKEDSRNQWTTLVHNGPMLAPPYQRLPSNVKFYYNSRPMQLSAAAEEAATFYGKLLKTDIARNPTFKANFFRDFLKLLTPQQRCQVRSNNLCNFEHIHSYFQCKAQQKRATSKKDKECMQSERRKEAAKFGYCLVDGRREKILNYRVEPPGIFRGRGNHPKMGMLKPRIMPEDIIINCSPCKAPAPPKGHKWQAVKSDRTVSWLACWHNPLTGQPKYIWLNSATRQHAVKDLNKFETARRLSLHIKKIRCAYSANWKSSNMFERQLGVALYLIDLLALRAGNEKDGNTADTVGCCTLRVEHLKLHDKVGSSHYVLALDFLGKDCIRYCKQIPLQRAAYKNLRLFMQGKCKNDLVFDQLSTSKLNEHLKTLMDGLTTKVFRTYNASVLLQKRLQELTRCSQSDREKLQMYRKANCEAALLCNHRRTVTTISTKALKKLKQQIKLKRLEIARFKRCKERTNAKRTLAKLSRELEKLEEKLANKKTSCSVALNTSKANYLDPRISVAWCKKYGLPIEKIFNATLRERFQWAMRVTDKNFRFELNSQR